MVSLCQILFQNLNDNQIIGDPEDVKDIISFDLENLQKDKKQKKWYEVLKVYKKKYDLITLGNYIVDKKAIDLDPEILLILQ